MAKTTGNGAGRPEIEIEASYDVVVVGGGAAGLSGAVALGRSRRSVLVVDAGEPRNAPADGVHNFLTREGVSPGELLATGRAEAARYGVRIVAGRAAAVRRLDAEEDAAEGAEAEGGDRFRVELADGRAARARRLLVATGLVDELPDVPGLAERWGRDVLHCPFCHGWEVRDQAIGVLASGPMAVHQARMFRQLSADVVVFRHTAPAFADEQSEELAALGIAVVAGEVEALEVADDRLTGVRLRSGEVVPRRALVVAPGFAARAEVLGDLGLETEEVEVAGHVVGTRVPAGPNGVTAVPGVWVAGNVADPMAQVISAAASGLMAGAAIHGDLIAEETAAAVAAHRVGSAAEREAIPA